MSIAAAALARADIMRMPTLSRRRYVIMSIAIRINVFLQDRKMAREITWEIV